MKLEAKVGIFVALALLCLFGLSTQIGQFSFSKEKGYTIDVLLDNAVGLNEKAKVRIKGVDSGYVYSIYLHDNKAYAGLFLKENIKIPKDSFILVSQESMLGGKYIEIIPGNSSELVQDGEKLERTKSIASLEETSQSIKEAAERFANFVTELHEIFGGENALYIKESIKNIHSSTTILNEFIKEEQGELPRILSHFDTMIMSITGTSNKFAETADLLNEKLSSIATKIDDFTTHADNLIEDNKEVLNKTLNSVDNFFVDGTRVVNRLDNYLSIIDKSQFEVGMRAEYLARDKRAKGVASVSYMPNPTRYYMFDVVSTDDYSRQDSLGNIIMPVRTDKSEYYISAQLGKRYNDILFRGGLIENSAGIGMDYFALRDKLKMTIDIYDFAGKLDLRGTSPHVRTYLRYTFLDYIDFTAGLDNFLNKEISSIYLGIGVRFVDNDIKSLVGTIGGAAGMAK